MSSFLCFICHSTVNDDTNEDTREKYKDVIGINLCPNSHLCYICCHMLNKLWLYKSVCLKRSLEYPVLFSEKGTLNLQKTDLEIHILCPDESCEHYQNRKINFESYHYDDIHTQYESQQYANNKYCQLQEEKEFDDFFQYGNQCPEYNCNLNDSKQTHIQENIKPSVSDCFDQNSCKSTENYEEVDNKSLLDNNEETDLHTDMNEVDNSEAELEKNIKNEYFLETSDITNVMKHPQEEIEMTTENTTEKKSKIKKFKKVGFYKIVLSLEEQKAELEALRREKKYMESEFKCFNCALGFLFKDTYQAHMMRHEESNGEYLCSICSLRFASPAVLRSHTAAHSLRYRCVQCTQNVKPRGRSTHIARCPNDPNTDVALGPNLAAACHLCAAMFRTSAGLQQHLKRFHKSKTSGKTYSCNVCGKSYNNQSAVRTHMIKHINRQFQCEQCEATFTSPYTLNQHKKKHAICGQPSDHYCETCDLRYTSRKSLLAHKRNALIHQQTVYDCNICNRICPNQRALATHIETIHAPEKKYACWTCGVRYGNKKSLLRHIRTHTEKQWKIVATCHLCGGNFKSNSKLNRHLREVCEKAKLEEQLSSLYEQE